jgi:hypothetical protein
MRAVTALCGALAIAALTVPGVSADEFNKRTYFSFSAPVQVPGATLPAGRYMFIMANPETSMDTLRITSADGRTVYAMFPVRWTDRRPDPVSEPTIVFAETPAGQPYAVRSWFYPGRKTGQEFVYPRTQAMKIAQATRTNVLAQTSNGHGTSRIGRIDANGRIVG